MCRFIETMKLQDGAISNLDMHQLRVNRTFAHFYPGYDISDLQKKIEIPHTHAEGLFKCRVVYDRYDFKFEFKDQKRLLIKSLKVIESPDHIDYTYKYENRSDLIDLYNQKGEADDIIISVNGRPTDSFYCNLVFFDGENWLTPKTPLLSGTMRQSLLERGEIIEADIKTESLKNFEKVSLINSMLDLREIEVPADRIYH